LRLHGKELADFDYSSFKQFLDDSKSKESVILENEKLLNVFKFVLSNYENTDNHIRRIKLALQYLIEYNYNADINKLKHV
jgi:hypothetical protein